MLEFVWQNFISYGYGPVDRETVDLSILHRRARHCMKYNIHFYIGIKLNMNGLWIPMLDLDNPFTTKRAEQWINRQENYNLSYVLFRSSKVHNYVDTSHYWMVIGKVFGDVGSCIKFMGQSDGSCHYKYIDYALQTKQLIVRGMPKWGQFPEIVSSRVFGNAPTYMQWLTKFCSWWDSDLVNEIRAWQIAKMIRGEDEFSGIR